MKKSLILFLTFVYLVVASGLAFNLHYCGGKISSISLAFVSNHDNCCGKKKMTKKNCCKNKTSVLKINENQHSSTSIKAPATSFKVIEACFTQINFNVATIIEAKNISRIHAPPDIYQDPIYLQYRVLII
ncbi:MAG: hypothetical protein NTX97_05840 [Bacteroidetes bacterium]|nr:hypothetical protein [Bacteroidota bacterium]